MIVRSVGEWVYAPQCFWEMALGECSVVWTYNRTALRLRVVNMQWNAYGIMFRVVWYMLGFLPVSCGVCICPGVSLSSAPGCFIYRFQRCSPLRALKHPVTTDDALRACSLIRHLYPRR